MAVYLKKFENHAAYEAAESGLILPNVSLCVSENEVHYKPIVKVSGVSLNKNSLSLNTGASETLVATVVPNDATDKSVTWSTSDSGVATVSQSGLVTAVATGSCTITVATTDGGFIAQCSTTISDPYAGHTYVDLGLPSGTKWATMNVGATGITDGGLYFQWGDTSGYTAAQVGEGGRKKYFGWADYKYGNGTSSPGETGMTKYNSTDGKIVLNTSDDAARVNWGGSWRMPTETEFNELTANTTFEWVTDFNGSGVNGAKYTAKNGNNNYVFFPAAGNCYDGTVVYVSGLGAYWSSSLYTSRMIYSSSLLFGSSFSRVDKSVRYAGCSVRGVVGD